MMMKDFAFGLIELVGPLLLLWLETISTTGQDTTSRVDRIWFVSSPIRCDSFWLLSLFHKESMVWRRDILWGWSLGKVLISQEWQTAAKEHWKTWSYYWLQLNIFLTANGSSKKERGSEDEWRVKQQTTKAQTNKGAGDNKASNKNSNNNSQRGGGVSFLLVPLQRSRCLLPVSFLLVPSRKAGALLSLHDFS